MLKRVISLILSLVMILGMMPVNLTAAAEEIPAEEISVAETTAPIEEETVPTEAEPEETVPEETFAEIAGTIPEETAPVYHAGGSVLASGTCGTNLTWVLTEDGVLTVSGTGDMDGYSAGGGVDSPWLPYREQVTKVIVEDGVTGIGFAPFFDMVALETVRLPEGISTIPGFAFSRCSNLTSVNIPASVTSIQSVVFALCENLTSITFQADAPAFEDGAFNAYTGTVYYPKDNPTWTEDVFQSYGGMITWIKEGESSGITVGGNGGGGGDYREDWPVGSGSWGPNATYTLDADGVLTISGTGTIGRNGDLGNNVKTIVIEDGITGIDDFAFGASFGVTSVVIADSVTSFGSEIFCYCSALTDVKLPARMTTIPVGMFQECRSLRSFDISDTVTTISDRAFRASGLEFVEVPEGVTYIGSEAFCVCTALESVSLPESLTEISFAAFAGCTSLQYVEIPVNVTAIRDQAFADVALSEIMFYGNAPAIDGEAFANVTATAYYPANNNTWTEEVMQDYGGDITWLPYGDVAEEEKVLFAAWDDFSNYMYDFPELPVNMMTMLVFCFGSEDDYVILSDNLTAGGCITMSPGATVNGNQTWDIWPTEMGPGTVTYTDPDTGKTYTFDVTVIEPWEGGEGEGPGGEGPGDEVDDSVIRLFARWDDASGFMESSEIRLDCTSPFVFCFGTYEDHIYVTDLELSGIATLSEQYITADGAPGYHLGVSGLGEGFVKYTHTDGVEYTYSVQGILGYPGDLIAVCKDPHRGYGGLEFMPYLTVGESFEAEFAVLDSMTTYRMLSEDAVYTTEGIATLERVNGTVYTIGVSGEGEGMIHYTEGDQSGTMYVYGNTEGQGPGGEGPGGEGPGGEGPGGDQGYPGVQNVQYRGQTVSVFIGDVWDDELHDIQGYGDNYGPRYYQDFHFRFLLGALADFDTNREALPPAEFYDCISDISFYLENTANEHPGDEKLNCWLTNDPDGDWQDCIAIDPAPYENEALGIYSAQTHLRAKAGQGFQATVCMTFTYDDPSDDIEAATYTVKISGGYASSGDVVLDLSAGENATLVDTAEELNAIVGDYDALLDWLETNFPESFEDHKPGATVTLNLPAVEYKDILTVNAKSDDGNTIGTNICLRGSTDENGNRTTLPGILAQAGLHEVLDIDFVYDPKVTYGDVLGNNKELSYGILADCRPGMDGTAEENGAFWNDVCNVGNCTFTGFDYGMMSTEYGYAGPAWGCTFTDCYYGIYMDCKDQGAGGNDNFSGNTFIGSKFAVCLRSLPGGSTPYSMRFHDNVFQKCDKEFKVTTSGNKHYFYFYRNYYDGSYHDGWKRAVTGETPRGARVELVDENGVQSSAVVLTDPCRINADMSVEGGLWIFGESTSILNAEADQLLIAQGALQDTRIGILDNNEEEIALWTFEKAAQVGYALQENNFNAGITISEIEDGIVGVTVGNDTQTDAILQERMPTLSVDCAFDEAYVMYGDRVIFSTLENGQISFTAAQGGEYRIVRGQASVTFAAMIGEVGYESLAQALIAAKSGDTIELAADVFERDIVVRKGITLNLNGYTLNTDYIFAVNGANIVDESEGNTGLLKADADCVLISKGNAQLPVWNGEGYVFTKVTYRKALVAHNADMVKFAFLPQFQSVATELLKDGAEGNMVTVEVRVSWETIQGREYRNLVFNNDQVGLGISSGGAFILTFSGFSQLNLTTDVAIEAVVYSETGVSVTSEAVVVDVTPE